MRPATSDIGASSGSFPRRVRDSLVGDGSDAGRQEVARLFRVGRQVQIGEDDLPASQFLAFNGERLLHLHDQIGGGKDLVRAADDAGTRGNIIGVADTGALAGMGFNDDLMTPGGQFLDRLGDEPDAVFLRFDFLRNADQHVRHPFSP